MALAKKNKDFWNSLLGYLPLFSVISILLALAKFYFYYDAFDINIIPYLTITELSLQVISDLIVFLVVLTILILFIRIMISPLLIIKHKKFLHLRVMVKIKNSPKAIRILLSYLFLFYLVMTFLTTSSFAANSLFFLFIIILTIASYIFADMIEKQIKYYYIITLLFFSILTFEFRKSTEDSIKPNYGSYKGTTIKTKDSTYLSTDTSYFIGNTSEFYFIRNRTRRNITIIPQREIIEMTINQVEIPDSLYKHTIRDKSRPSKPPAIP